MRGDLSQKSDPAALRFRSHQDAIDFASHGIEQKNRMLAVYNFVRVVENYRKGYLAIVGRAVSRASAHEFNLVFVSVEGHLAGLNKPGKSGELQAGVPGRYRDKFRVFLEVAKGVQSPEGVIPSLVWLEAGEKVSDFRRDVFQAVEFVREKFRPFHEGEISEVGIGMPIGDGGCVGSLIEAGPQIRYEIEDDARKFVCEPLVKAEFMDLLGSGDVIFDKVGPRFIPVDFVVPSAKIAEMVMCTTQRAFGAGE